MRYSPFTRLGAIAFILVGLAIASAPLLAEESAEERVARINKENAEKGYNWTAGITSMSRLSPEEKNARSHRRHALAALAARLPEVMAELE